MKLYGLKVDVTAEDIERAHRNDSYRCVVAEAIARGYPDAYNVEVDTQTIRFTTDKGERIIYVTPPAVMGYVIAFDAGEAIEPFSFTLREPHRMKRRILTDAGRKVRQAQDRERRRRAKLGLRDGDAPAGEADDKPTAEAVKAAYAGAVKRVSVGEGRRATPRVFKRRKRVFGMRTLRVNRETA